MDNPYQTGAYGSTYPTATGQVSPGVIQALNGTKPWVRLCSVMGFVFAGFMILAGLMMIAGGAIGGMSRSAAAGLGWIQTVVGLFYIAMSLMYLFPAVKLWKYGTSILRLMSTRSAADLEQALEEQRGFWKFVGIVLLISLGLMLVGFVLVIIAGVASAAALSK
ncbi:DUF5362 family protein [Luteolibacter arcticus]|uniref:DUF5362 family protein n=1 Tax=Luteolibacter arcticus TaxID=1581411 RepID=A0ABT3GBD5_9BACT|nr:DUF5362 family protein [Luteolibacter arcticus]MCW1920936.1 DUF5362 family protein [Luteolibacter arcticus]